MSEKQYEEYKNLPEGSVLRFDFALHAAPLDKEKVAETIDKYEQGEKTWEAMRQHELETSWWAGFKNKFSSEELSLFADSIAYWEKVAKRPDCELDIVTDWEDATDNLDRGRAVNLQGRNLVLLEKPHYNWHVEGFGSWETLSLRLGVLNGDERNWAQGSPELRGDFTTARDSLSPPEIVMGEDNRPVILPQQRAFG